MIFEERYKAFTIIIIVIHFLISCDEISAETVEENIDYDIVAIGVFASFFATGTTIHNIARLRSDDPSKVGGFFGTALGISAIFYGGTLLYSDNDELVEWGLGFTCVGATTLFYGVKTLLKARSNYITNKNISLSIDPTMFRSNSEECGFGIRIKFAF